MPQQGTLQSAQYMSGLTKGPDGANTLFLGAGLMACSLSHQNHSGGGVALEETFSVLLDQPRLNPGQFRRAIATASLAGLNGTATIVALGSAPGVSWYVQAVEAHFDDETGGVRLLVDLHAGAAFGSAEIGLVGFQVMTSAAV
jgi:hypothetical protein